MLSAEFMTLMKMDDGAAATGKEFGEAGDGNPTPSTNCSRKTLNFKVKKQARTYNVESSHLEESLFKHEPKINSCLTDLLSDDETDFEKKLFAFSYHDSSDAASQNLPNVTSSSNSDSDSEYSCYSSDDDSSDLISEST